MTNGEIDNTNKHLATNVIQIRSSYFQLENTYKNWQIPDPDKIEERNGSLA